MTESRLTPQEGSRLVAAAFAARERAYVPYSHYAVGSALLDNKGNIHTGCNIENAAFTPTVCAERTAFFSALKENIREFTAIAVVGGPAGSDPEGFAPPCGVCRQVMAEFCRADFEILLASDKDNPVDYQVYTLAELLPLSFTSKDMN